MKKQFKQSEALIALGIQVCQNCGKHMSLENSTCYGCGFERDNLFIHEENLNNKYEIGNKINFPLILVKRKENSYHKDPTFMYHIMKGDKTLCGVISQTSNPFEIVGNMSFVLIPQFYKNPCKYCLRTLENQK